MRLLHFIMLLFLFVIGAVCAQEPAAADSDSFLGQWRTVLEPGTLDNRPDIVPTDGGFAISAASFAYASWSFSSDWFLYNPASGSWSSYVPPREPSQRVNISQLGYIFPEVADMFPADAEPEIQFVDGESKAVFLVDAGRSIVDNSDYFGVNILDLATSAVTKLNLWTCWGVPRSNAIVWEFPEEKLIASCGMLVWLDGDSIREEWISEYIGGGESSMLHLVSTSPDNRFWILRTRYWHDPWYGHVYLYDRQTGWTTILLWRDYRIPHHPVVWFSDSTLIVNEGDFVLHFDTEDYQRRTALADELLALPDEPAYAKPPYLSLDGQWLLVFTERGGLVLRSVFDALGIRD